MAESLMLKWGTIKGRNDFIPQSVALVERFFADGVCMSAAMDHHGDDRKAILCELIDQLDGEIWNDWDGKVMSKEATKKYVLDYGQKK